MKGKFKIKVYTNKKYKRLKKMIDEQLKRNGYNFTTDLIEKHSFWEVEELLGIGHYRIINSRGFISDI